MTQETDVDALVRQRIRGLREARGWSLDVLAARCFLSPSTLSRIETGHRRIALDQLVPLAKALDTTLDEPHRVGGRRRRRDPAAEGRRGRAHHVGAVARRGARRASSSRRCASPHGARSPSRSLGVHPGRDWFTVLSGTARLQLGERTILVEAGDAAEFSTMVPHAISAHRGVAEVLTILDRDGQRAHLATTGAAAEAEAD
ncbi:helix-turn-helix domain-containing protein [Clavibacter tessellarius]|uniref:helix-turn-helix domain-containing protein n=1 Tax=Clavibacter tessellarius TaxID=31965 RepID=UPI0032490CB5